MLVAFIPDDAVMSANEIPAAAFRMYAYFCMRRNADTGVCFPKLKTIAAELEMGYSYASETRKVLLEKGWIVLEPNGDIRPMKGFNVLQIPNKSSVKPETVSAKPETNSSVNSETSFGKNRTNVPQKPNIVSVKTETPIITSPINQPIEPTHLTKKKADVVLATKDDKPDCLSLETWERWLKHRKEKKHPVTRTQVVPFAKELEKFRARGMPPDEVVDRSIANGWQGLFALPDERNGSGRLTGAAANMAAARIAMERQRQREAREAQHDES